MQATNKSCVQLFTQPQPGRIQSNKTTNKKKDSLLEGILKEHEPNHIL